MPRTAATSNVEPMTTMLAGDHTTITVRGVLDSGRVPELKRHVRGTARRVTDVLVLDLSAVTACDYGVLELLLQAQAFCSDKGVALRVSPSPAVRHLMSPTY